MKKILITGASGFVGSHVCELIHDVFDLNIYGTVYGPGFDISAQVKPGNIIQINLLDAQAVSSMIQTVKPDYVLHLAALSSPKASFDDDGKTASDNFQLSLILLQALQRYAPEVEKVLLVGSAEEYGKVEEDEVPINEATPLRPLSPYAVSKVAQDYLGLQYFLTHNMPIVRLRPFNHTGERRPPHFVLPAFAQQIALIEAGDQEPVLKVGNLEAVRDFCDVKDMAKAYILALEKAKPGEAYNIGAGVGTSIQQILDTLLQLSNKKIKVTIDPDRIKPADVPVMIANPAKFARDTGWKPEIGLDETIARVLDYWRHEVSNTN